MSARGVSFRRTGELSNDCDSDDDGSATLLNQVCRRPAHSFDDVIGKHGGQLVNLRELEGECFRTWLLGGNDLDRRIAYLAGHVRSGFNHSLSPKRDIAFGIAALVHDDELAVAKPVGGIANQASHLTERIAVKHHAPERIDTVGIEATGDDYHLGGRSVRAPGHQCALPAPFTSRCISSPSAFWRCPDARFALVQLVVHLSARYFYSAS